MPRSRLTRFPSEFEALLSPLGCKVLQGKDQKRSGALSREKFFSDAALLDPNAVGDCTLILQKTFTDLLVELTRGLPAANASQVAYDERLPKVARMLTVPEGVDTDTEAYRRGEACGLAGMMLSESFRAFVGALAARPVDGPKHLQVLCYRAGDYAGPHTDHHPEQPQMINGYFDVHLTFCTKGVSEQLIIYEREGHLSEQRSIAQSGLVTAYRLPFWHYTTPMQVSRPSARRWLVLGTFFDGVS